jgi:hypothetical protein
MVMDMLCGLALSYNGSEWAMARDRKFEFPRSAQHDNNVDCDLYDVWQINSTQYVSCSIGGTMEPLPQLYSRESII